MTFDGLGAEQQSPADGLRGALSGQYDVERELGRGGAATVFLARDLRHARSVALKVMSPDAVSVGGTERFLNEIRTAARLNHPHILGVHDSGDANGQPYYVMPYVAGESLRDRLARDGALPLAETVRLIRELADALGYAHAHGVVHRDLKPENVLLSGGHAVIADFGIAKGMADAAPGAQATPGLTGTGVAIGTPAYMAPEQVVGDRQLDQRADLYALGVVAYEMLAGAHPFGARSPQAMAAANLTETPTPLGERRPGIPPALSAIVMRLLEKDPARRPANADEVRRVIDDASTSVVATVARPGGRGILLGAAAALVIVALVGYVAWTRFRGPSSGASRDGIHSLAVIPFENTGGNAEDDYFSSGLTDELAHALTRLPGLSISPRSATLAFKGKAASAAEIGRALNVVAYIGGTVRRAGGSLRITTQLVGTGDGKVLWDSVYQSESHDVFGVQDEFTRAVAGALARRIGDQAAAASPRLGVRRGTASEAAYDLFLKGQYHFLARGVDNVTRSVAEFRQAIAIDPQFARAHANLATAYATLRTYLTDPADSLPALSLASAERAVTIDSSSAEAQAALGAALGTYLRLPEAALHYQRAIALDPSLAPVRLAYGFHQLTVGETDEALRQIRESVRLDPLVPSARTGVALALTFARRYAEAIDEARRFMRDNPTFPLTALPLALSQAMTGQGDSAVATLQNAPAAAGLPFYRRILLFSYASAGRWPEAERVRAELRATRRDANAELDLAFAELLFGDPKPMIRALSTPEGQRRWNSSGWLGCSPLIDPLWSDGEFVASMRAIEVKKCDRAAPWPITRPSR